MTSARMALSTSRIADNTSAVNGDAQDVASKLTAGVKTARPVCLGEVD
jgi:hypothetical protein